MPLGHWRFQRPHICIFFEVTNSRPLPYRSALTADILTKSLDSTTLSSCPLLSSFQDYGLVLDVLKFNDNMSRVAFQPYHIWNSVDLSSVLGRRDAICECAVFHPVSFLILESRG